MKEEIKQFISISKKTPSLYTSIYSNSIYKIYYVIQNGFFSHLYKTKLVKKFKFISKHLTSGKYTSNIERLDSIFITHDRMRKRKIDIDLLESIDRTTLYKFVNYLAPQC